MSKANEIFEEIELSNDTSVTETGQASALKPGIGSLEQVVRHFSHCQICGGRMHFNYVSDFSRNTTQEKAICPECGLDTREVLHRLQ
jgi:hypothetical protein